MPKLVHNSWAWWRTYLSAHGPEEGRVRLALDGYMRCMHLNGRGSWPGVRLVGELTGQNKDTVLRYRAEALELGWLVMAPRGQAQHQGEVWASVPDSVPIHPRYLTAPVRQDRSECPAASDITLQNSLLTLEEISTANGSGKAEELARRREPHLRRWLATNPLAQRYRGDCDSLARLTPVELRFNEFQKVIVAVEEALRRNGGDGT